MKEIFQKNKFTVIFLTLVFVMFAYLQLGGYSFGDRLDTTVEKAAHYGSSTHHK